jgi:surface protein
MWSLILTLITAHAWYETIWEVDQVTLPFRLLNPEARGTGDTFQYRVFDDITAACDSSPDSNGFHVYDGDPTTFAIGGLTAGEDYLICFDSNFRGHNLDVDGNDFVGDSVDTGPLLREVRNWGDNIWGPSMYEFFAGTQNFIINASAGIPNLQNVRSTEAMFVFSPFNQPIGNWNVSQVTNMAQMFAYSPFNQPIGDWDVSQVADMTYMFVNSQFNQPIGDWNVSQVTNMAYMFVNSQFNQPIGNWNVSQVTDMIQMFAGSNFDQEIGSWNIAQGTDTQELLSQSSMSIDNYDLTIIGWNNNLVASNVTDLIIGVDELYYCQAGAARNNLIVNQHFTFSGDNFGCFNISFKLITRDEVQHTATFINDGNESIYITEIPNVLYNCTPTLVLVGAPFVCNYNPSVPTFNITVRGGRSFNLRSFGVNLTSLNNNPGVGHPVPGNYSDVVPAGVCGAQITVAGAGGGRGDNSYGVGGRGGSGSLIQITFDNLTIGQMLQFEIGNVGHNGARINDPDGINAEGGQLSSLSIDWQLVLVAGGGGGGGGYGSGNGGDGGTVNITDASCTPGLGGLGGDGGNNGENGVGMIGGIGGSSDVFGDEYGGNGGNGMCGGGGGGGGHTEALGGTGATGAENGGAGGYGAGGGGGGSSYLNITFPITNYSAVPASSAGNGFAVIEWSLCEQSLTFPSPIITHPGESGIINYPTVAGTEITTVNNPGNLSFYARNGRIGFTVPLTTPPGTYSPTLILTIPGVGIVYLTLTITVESTACPQLSQLRCITQQSQSPYWAYDVTTCTCQCNTVALAAACSSFGASCAAVTSACTCQSL